MPIETNTGTALPEISILGIKVSMVTGGELNDAIGQIIRRGGKELVLNVNIHAINQALKHPFMRELLNRAGIVFCDGYGVILGGKILGVDIPERITPADWLWDLSAVCEREGYSFYFLGGREGIAAQAADKLRERYPNLRVVGVRNGYFSKEGPENEAVIREINAIRPDILLVGFGMPLQEWWLSEYWKDVHAHVALPVGALFEFISGTVRRAPRWMSDNGLEWLFRYLLEPRRMFVRYIIGNPLFILRVIRERLVQGRSRIKVNRKSG